MYREPQWHKDAKRLRSEGVKLKDIAKELNRSLNGVYNIVRDVEVPVENRGRPKDPDGWHDQAKVMRKKGETLQAIGDKFGISRQRVAQICVGIESPVENRGNPKGENYRTGVKNVQNKPEEVEKPRRRIIIRQNG